MQQSYEFHPAYDQYEELWENLDAGVASFNAATFLRLGNVVSKSGPIGYQHA